MKTHIARILRISVLLPFLISCSEAARITPSDLGSSKTTHVIERTDTPSPTATVGISTATPSPTMPASRTPTSTITSIPAPPTWTPLPKLSPEEAQAKVIDLLTRNAGCELPCWLGVTPGETRWEEAEHYFLSFVDEIIKTEITNTTEGSQFAYSLVFNLPNKASDRIGGFLVSDKVISEVSAKSGTELRYQVSNLLSLHGKPEEIILKAMPDTNSGKPWVSFYLYYPEQGILAQYGGEARLVGEKIKMCPKGIGPRLRLYPPGSLTLQEMIRRSYDAPFRLPSIDENPGWSVERFYEEMKVPGACFVVEPSK